MLGVSFVTVATSVSHKCRSIRGTPAASNLALLQRGRDLDRRSLTWSAEDWPCKFEVAVMPRKVQAAFVQPGSARENVSYVNWLSCIRCKSLQGEMVAGGRRRGCAAGRLMDYTRGTFHICHLCLPQCRHVISYPWQQGMQSWAQLDVM
jgi:hypothetical protein